ncbi:MAG: DegT/DnrJ/EryC1/StrS family aminotransferase [Bacteroidales bacterium]|nr:DegT/DnrJ/EryC1/StrS family aminotransferase [Bacteroidales bacterium]
MKKKDFTRRQFVSVVSAGSVGVVASGAVTGFDKITGMTQSTGKLAILGGDPVRKNKPWHSWPFIDKNVVDSIIKTTNSGKWCRMGAPNSTVTAFEKEFSGMLGARFFVGTGSGTQALNTCVEALEIGAGDEVITSPYSDMGTIASILVCRALPVMADLDPDSYQLDPDDVERKITPNTKAIMPVHIMGVPCNMERIMAIAKKHNLKVIEDACQAHLAEYKGKKLGTIGDLGSFSFQESKVISCGEGGGVVGNDDVMMERVFTVQNHGTTRKGITERIGPKYRMTEFEGAILMGQMPGFKERHEIRNRNANYLRSKLKDFPGLVPQKQYDGTASSAYYKFAMTYHKEHFNNADRSKFLKAVTAEGIGLSGYIANGLHKEPWTDYIMNLKVYQKMYSPARLQKYKSELNFPNCDNVCRDVVILNGPGPLLGTQEDMDDIINAVMKIYENRDKLNSI